MSVVERLGGEEAGRETSITKVGVASAIGATIEWYDFFLYGTAAGLIFNQLFFPPGNPTASTLAAYATFAAGFVARPIGGFIFGHFGDRIGRKTMLLDRGPTSLTPRGKEQGARAPKESPTVDKSETIRHLEEDARMFEITRTTTFQGSDLQGAFKGYRENKAGEKVEITVEVLDVGDGAGAHRYAVSAYSQDGKEAHGNEAATLDEAIPNVQWEALD